MEYSRFSKYPHRSYYNNNYDGDNSGMIFFESLGIFRSNFSTPKYRYLSKIVLFDVL